MNLSSRIFLVGMPGSGKSTVGKYLSKELEYSFIDLDDVIEKNAGNTISWIFQNLGEEAFRKQEQAALRSISQEKVVVATGGGAACFNDNMDWMNQHGFTIFLNQDIKTLLERTREQHHRPLLQDDQETVLKNLLEVRLPFYKKAGIESDLSEPCEILAELYSSFRS